MSEVLECTLRALRISDLILTSSLHSSVVNWQQTSCAHRDGDRLANYCVNSRIIHAMLQQSGTKMWIMESLSYFIIVTHLFDISSRSLRYRTQLWDGGSDRDQRFCPSAEQFWDRVASSWDGTDPFAVLCWRIFEGFAWTENPNADKMQSFHSGTWCATTLTKPPWLHPSISLVS